MDESLPVDAVPHTGPTPAQMNRWTPDHETPWDGNDVVVVSTLSGGDADECAVPRGTIAGDIAPYIVPGSDSRETVKFTWRRASPC